MAWLLFWLHHNGVQLDRAVLGVAPALAKALGVGAGVLAGAAAGDKVDL